MAMSASRLDQRVPQLGLAVHQRLGPVVVLRRAALDQVGGERERGAGEADERLAAELADQGLHRLADEGDVGGLERAQPRHVAHGADRPLHHGADPRLDVHVHADRAQRYHDVAVQDRRVDVVPAQRLQGDLGNELGPGARVEHRDALADPLVLGQRPPRLPHEPDRGVRHRLAAARADEGRALRLVRLGVGHAREFTAAPRRTSGHGGRTGSSPRETGRAGRPIRWRLLPSGARARRPDTPGEIPRNRPAPCQDLEESAGTSRAVSSRNASGGGIR